MSPYLLINSYKNYSSIKHFNFFTNFFFQISIKNQFQNFSDVNLSIKSISIFQKICNYYKIFFNLFTNLVVCDQKQAYELIANHHEKEFDPVNIIFLRCETICNTCPTKYQRVSDKFFYYFNLINFSFCILYFILNIER